MSEPSESQIDHPRQPAAPLVVVVTGLPASGKTSVALEIAAHHRLPLLCKDQVKEILFETLGWSDRAWSRRLGRASAAALLLFLQSRAAAGLPCIIESNSPGRRRANCWPSSVNSCFVPFRWSAAPKAECLRRFQARSGQRHPWHEDENLHEEYRSQLLAARYDPLDIGGTLWELVTNDRERLDVSSRNHAIGQEVQADHRVHPRPATPGLGPSSPQFLSVA